MRAREATPTPTFFTHTHTQSTCVSIYSSFFPLFTLFLSLTLQSFIINLNTYSLFTQHCSCLHTHTHHTQASIIDTFPRTLSKNSLINISLIQTPFFFSPSSTRSRVKDGLCESLESKAGRGTHTWDTHTHTHIYPWLRGGERDNEWRPRCTWGINKTVLPAQ